MKYRTEQNPEGDDPYDDIRIKRGHTTIARFPLDDAPVADFNAEQRDIARIVCDFLNEVHGGEHERIG